MTRPGASALTSACSSATSDPVTRRYRSIVRLSTCVVSTAIGSGFASAFTVVALPPQPAAAAATAATNNPDNK
jgi:hypothetical protein